MSAHEPAAGASPREPLIVHATLAPRQDDEALDLAVAWRFLARNATLIVACALLGSAGGMALSYLFPKVYRTEVTLEPVTANDSSGDLAGLASRFGGIAGLLGVELGANPQSTASSMAVLQSRRLLTSYIAENNLLPVLYSSYIDQLLAGFRGTDDPGPTLQDAYKRFSTKVFSAREDRKTGLVIVTVEWRDPALAASWANGIVAEANRVIAGQIVDETKKNLDFLNKELEETNTLELRKIIYSLIEKEIGKGMMARTRPDYAFRVLDPAVQPDDKLFVKPRRALFTLGGLAMGVLAAISWALFRTLRTPH